MDRAASAALRHRGRRRRAADAAGPGGRLRHDAADAWPSGRRRRDPADAWPGGRRRGDADDAGSGTVLVVGLVAVVLVCCLAVGVLASAQRARATAQTAADLGALAAGVAVSVPPGVVDRTGDPDACGRAGQVVARHGAQLVRCAVHDGVVDVTVTRPAPLGVATAVARAGPQHARDGVPP